MAKRLSRPEVVERAALLADEVGLHQLSFTRLGRALGIAPPGVYRHVANLNELRAAINAHAARQVTAALSSACTGLSERDALAALAQTLRAWAKEHPGQYEALQIAPEPDDGAGQIAAEALLSVITASIKGYSLPDVDLTDSIRLIRSTVHGFVALELAGGFKQPRDINVSFERAIDSLDSTLRTWAMRPDPAPW